MKAKALEWISSLYEKKSLDMKLKVLMDITFFYLNGFADEPEVYISEPLLDKDWRSLELREMNGFGLGTD